MSVQKKKKVRILSLDGGGMRGIIPATIVKYAEEYLQEKKPGTTIADHFDFFAGSSAGGILAATYLMPQRENKDKAKFSAKDALNFYINHGYSVFNASEIRYSKRLWGFKSAARFSPKNLEILFREKFADIKISELIKPCIILTYDMIQKSLFLFKSADDTNKRDFLVRDTLRSTTAGPTYFPPAKIKNLASDSFRDPKCGDMINIDGGLVAINPAVFAFAEAGKMNFEARNNNRPAIFDLQILSIGSGSRNFEIEHFERRNHWGLMKWIQLLPKIIFEGGIDMVEFQMKGIFQNSNPSLEQAYLRINAPKEIRGNYSDISDASPRNVLNLVKAGEKTIEYAKSQGLERFLDTLLD